MKTQHSTANLEEARTVFLNELPDPQNCGISTVIEHFAIEGVDIMLLAQKSKGTNGMFWSIENLN